MKMRSIRTDGDFLTGRKYMFSFYCKACDQEVDSEACRLADIIENSGGRLYVFECCDCGEVSSSELLQEYEYDLEG